MENSVARRKESLRRQCRKGFEDAAPDRRQRADRATLATLLKLAECTAARVVHTYVSIGAEVDTRRFVEWAWAQGRQVVVPVVQERRRLRHARLRDWDQLVAGPLGVQQPGPDHGEWLADLAAIELVLVPGLAFDRMGGRLGQGGGYYDHFLAQVQAPKIGLARAHSLIERVPLEPHDMAMDIVVAEGDIYRRKT